MSTIIYKGGGGVQKVQNLVYVENGCPLNVNSELNTYYYNTQIFCSKPAEKNLEIGTEIYLGNRIEIRIFMLVWLRFEFLIFL